VGTRLTAGNPPVPVRLTVCGLPLALSVTVSAPVRVPVAVGVNVTLIVQLAPAATLDPQLLVWEKSVEEVEIAEIVKGDVPLSVRMTVWGKLVVPTS